MTADTKTVLPRLPMPSRTIYGDNRTVDGHYFTAQQMREYAERAVLSAIDSEREKLIDALQMAKHIVDANGTQEQLDQVFEALESVGVKP